MEQLRLIQEVIPLATVGAPVKGKTSPVTTEGAAQLPMILTGELIFNPS